MKQTALVVACFICAGLTVGAQTAQDPPKKQPDKRNPGRSVIPGIGGAIGAKKPPVDPKTNIKPNQPQFPLIGPNQSPFGPTLPGGPMQQPPIGPVQPGLPGMGLNGMQARPLTRVQVGAAFNWWSNTTPTAWSRNVAVLKHIGAQVTRVDIAWSKLEPAPGKYSWAEIDKLVAVLRPAGIRGVGVVSSPPSWAMKSGGSGLVAINDAALPKLQAFAQAIAARYPMDLSMFVLDVLDKREPSDKKAVSRIVLPFSTGARAGNFAVRLALGTLPVGEADKTIAQRPLGLDELFDAIAVSVNVANAPQNAANAIASAQGLSKLPAKPIWILDWSEAPPLQSSGLPAWRLAKDWLAELTQSEKVDIAVYSEAISSAKRGVPLRVATGLSGVGRAIREMTAGVTTVEVGRRASLLAALSSLDKAASGVRVVRLEADLNAPVKSAVHILQGAVATYAPGVVEAMIAGSDRLAAAKLGYFVIDVSGSTDSARMETSSNAYGVASAPKVNVDFTYVDAMVAGALKIGAKPVLRFGIPPSGIGTRSPDSPMPANPQAYVDMVKAFVSRYGANGKVEHWELSYDGLRALAPAREWAEFYKLFAGTVLSGQQSAKVGGLAVPIDHISLLEELSAQTRGTNLVPAFISWSAAGANAEDVATSAKAVRTIANQLGAGKTQTWLTGWGLDPWQPVRNSMQGALLALDVAASLPKDTVDVVMHSSAFDPPAMLGSRNVRAAGLLAANGAAHPVMDAAFAAREAGSRLIADTEDPRIHCEIRRSPNRLTLILHASDPGAGSTSDPMSGADAGTRLVAMNISNPTWKGECDIALSYIASETLAKGLPTNVAPATFTSPSMDAELAIPLPEGVIAIVSITPRRSGPVTIKAEVEKPFLSPGDTAMVIATASNTGKSASSVKLAITLPEDWKLSKEGRAAFRVPAGEERKSNIELQSPVDKSYGLRFVTVSAGAVKSTVAFIVRPTVTASLTSIRTDVAEPGAKPDSLQGSAPIQVTLANQSTTDRSVGLVAGRNSQSARLKPNERTSIDMRAAPELNDPGVYSVPVRIVEGERVTSDLPLLVGVPALAYQLPEAPRINGDLADWGDSYPLVLSASRGANTAYARLAAGAQAFAGWDADNLYIAVGIVDEEPNLAQGLLSILQSDRIEVLVAQPRGVDGWRRAKTARVLVAPALAGVVTAKYGENGSLAALPLKAVVQRSGRRAYYEVAIPWKSLGFPAPTNGEVLGLGLIVHDGSRGILAEFGQSTAGRTTPELLTGIRLTMRAARP